MSSVFLHKQKDMKQFLFFSDNGWAGLILRLTVGFIMLPHGIQKMFGWFNGYGFRATIHFFTTIMKLPWLISFAIIIIEFFGSLALLAGVGTRLFAFLFIVIMTSAIITTNYQHGLFMNWTGNQKGEGYEYHVLVIGICVALLVSGGGNYSIDAMIVNAMRQGLWRQ